MKLTKMFILCSREFYRTQAVKNHSSMKNQSSSTHLRQNSTKKHLTVDSEREQKCWYQHNSENTKRACQLYYENVVKFGLNLWFLLTTPVWWGENIFEFPHMQINCQMGLNAKSFAVKLAALVKSGCYAKFQFHVSVMERKEKAKCNNACA